MQQRSTTGVEPQTYGYVPCVLTSRLPGRTSLLPTHCLSVFKLYLPSFLPPSVHPEVNVRVCNQIYYYTDVMSNPLTVTIKLSLRLPAKSQITVNIKFNSIRYYLALFQI